MPSELRVNTLKDASGNNSVGMSTVAEGSAKAWASYNGSGTTFADSFNMASATDNSTGNYTFALTNAMGNANYAASTIAHPGTTTSPAIHTCEADCSAGYLAGSLRVENAYSTLSTARTEYDFIKCAVTFHGDLA